MFMQPWLVKYALSDPSGPVQSAVLSSPNDVLKVRKGGVYKLLEVRDLLSEKRSL